jgi:hypothetical protein
MIGNQRGNTPVQIIWSVAGLVVIVAGLLFIRGTLTSAPVKFTTPYQAVLLTSGSAYFGRLEGYGTSRPVLNEVYYIVTQTNPETKQTNNILVKRGKEMHEPDRMYLNPSQIIAVEPVGPNSQIAQQIAKSQAQH